MARKRAAERDLRIPLPKEPNRRNDTEQDPELWAVTYFAARFLEAFTKDRRDMLLSIIHAARYGGDQSVAGSRGEGKTSIAMTAALNLMVRKLSTFPVVIGKNQKKSQAELKDFRRQLQQNDRFMDDYPEIGTPFKAVGGWASRGNMQTVGGEFTNIVVAVDHIVFPTIARWQLPDNWPDMIVPTSCGQVLYCLGIDGPIRGTKYGDRRPTLAIIDDIEDREAAASEVIIARNEEIIEQDIAGLSESSERTSRVMLCTTQNRKCIAYVYTDPKQKPSWKGRRYRKMVKPPDRMDLVDQYIQLRKEKTTDDPDARVAFGFWRDNKDAIEFGCVVSNPESHSKKNHADGEPLELSACQAYYNRVADNGVKSVATEIDNDPPESVGPLGIGLTAEIVASRISGLSRRQLPANAIALTAAIDLGKYRCHWVVIAWWKGGGGCVVDYGVAEVSGNEGVETNEASEPMIYKCLLNFRDELSQKKYVDGTGTERQVDFCLVDSGAFTNAAYEFCRQVKGIYHPSKGIPHYRQKKESTDKVLAGSNLHAQKLDSQGIWLYELDTSYWKQWVHERFLTPTFDDNNMLRHGALSLYSLEGSQRHSSFAQHIVAEELVTEFKEGKGAKTFWNVKNNNNHWLDAGYMAAAAGEVCGVKLISASEVSIEPRHVDKDKQKQKQQAKPHGRFRTRPGGWVPRRRG